MKFYIFIFCLSFNFLIAQNEAQKWYFGIHAALDFSINPPTIPTNNAMTTGEGCSSIADSNGNLLMYTDGTTIWDRTHNIMANGSGLKADASATQSSIILKQPGNNNIYYVFTQGGSYGANTGLYYSIIDISLASGNGSVTVKNATVFTSGTEKIASVRHGNNNDHWILSHDWNNNHFRANLLTSNGVVLTPTLSQIGSVISGIVGGSNFPMVGQLKFSPDGRKVGQAVYSNVKSFELFDFDNETGVLSNFINLGNIFDEAYGCEFSPDGTKFYGGTLVDGNIWQWNLCAGSNTAIINSKTSIGFSPSLSIGSFQLALNGKIYVVKVGNAVLGVINDPNKTGIICNYVDSALSCLPYSPNYGLPAFSSSYFYQGPTVTISSSPNNTICNGEYCTLVANGANTYTWSTSVTGPSLNVQPNQTTTYSVIGTTSLGCNFEDKLTVTVNLCEGIEDYTADSDFKVYPNPMSTVLKIEGLESTIGSKISIVNQLNQIIYSDKIIDKETIINVENFNYGFYFILIENKNRTERIKLFKE